MEALMELSQLRYAVKLAETRNFSKAAEQLFITQPALSRQINTLEEELGLKLFERTTRRVIVTDAGEAFVQGARRVLAETEELEHAMALQRREIRGTLSVGLLRSLAYLHMPEYLNSFQAIYPNVQIELQVDWSAQLTSKVLNQEIDVAVTNIFFPEHEKVDPRLNIQYFLEDSVVVVASPNRDFQGRDYLEVEDFNTIPVVAMGTDTSIRAQMDSIFATHKITPRIICTCPDMDSLMAMVRADLGVTFLSSGVAEPYVKEGLVSLPLRPLAHTRTAMITLNQPTISGPLRLFKDYFYGITH